MTEFEKVWSKYSKDVNLEYVEPKEIAEEFWNAALNKAHTTLPNMSGYKYAHYVQKQFDKNIEQLKNK